MKLISALLAIAFVGIVFNRLSDSSLAHAQTVEAATNAIKRDQKELRETATMTRAQATQLGTDLDRQHAALPSELEDFNRSTQRLTTLREHLRADIADYQSAYTTRLAEFDTERAQITNPTTQRTIAVLRRHTDDDMNERVQNANSTLDTLDNVLAQGSDLQHAAQCVIIANDLHTNGEDLDQQLKEAKTTANTYATTTTNLLARINTALAE
jgi:predicted  nucleic acid-binding Zn-ribbon protein